MDPNANLDEQRRLIHCVNTSAHNLSRQELERVAGRLAELSLYLDEWMLRGGFLPRDWDRAPLPRVNLAAGSIVTGDGRRFKTVSEAKAHAQDVFDATGRIISIEEAD